MGSFHLLVVRRDVVTPRQIVRRDPNASISAAFVVYTASRRTLLVRSWRSGMTREAPLPRSTRCRRTTRARSKAARNSTLHAIGAIDPSHPPSASVKPPPEMLRDAGRPACRTHAVKSSTELLFQQQCHSSSPFARRRNLFPLHTAVPTCFVVRSFAVKLYVGLRADSTTPQ